MLWHFKEKTTNYSHWVSEHWSTQILSQHLTGRVYIWVSLCPYYTVFLLATADESVNVFLKSVAKPCSLIIPVWVRAEGQNIDLGLLAELTTRTPVPIVRFCQRMVPGLLWPLNTNLSLSPNVHILRISAVLMKMNLAVWNEKKKIQASYILQINSFSLVSVVSLR